MSESLTLAGVWIIGEYGDVLIKGGNFEEEGLVKEAGNYVREEILSNFIRLVAHTSELHAYTVQRLYSDLKDDISQESLTLAGVWIIGEYGDVLIKGGNFEEEGLVKEAGNYVREEILSNFIRLVAHTSELHAYTVQRLYSDLKDDISQESLTLAGVWIIGEYGDVLIKGGNFEEEGLVKEVTEPDVITLIESILYETVLTIMDHQRIFEVEIQQRSVEYTNLFDFDNIRSAVLERMPVPDYKEESSTSRPVYDIISDENNGSGSGTNSGDILLDFESEVVDSGSNKQTTMPSTSQNTADEVIRQILLRNLLNQRYHAFITTELGGPDPYVAYNKNGFKITLKPSKNIDNPNLLDILVTFLNVGVGSSVQNLLFQAAVPKTQKLQMQPPSATTIIPGSSATQLIRVMNPAKTNVRLRLRIVYQTSAGSKVDEIAEFNEFPQEFW
ncbi:4510_t:CDS:10 [Entrophospora sp. SA101]|nr:4510_t:CDS:10 [Entrophospora sp. SA101]